MAHDAAPVAAPVNERRQGIDLFNKTWGFIDNASRTVEEAEAMVHCAEASFWHWSQAPEATGQNFNIGYWQLSRVYSLAKFPEMAAYYGERCRATAYEHDLAPFYKAYAWEALARAAQVAGNESQCADYLKEAEALLPAITDADELGLIEPDLAQLR